MNSFLPWYDPDRWFFSHLYHDKTQLLSHTDKSSGNRIIKILKVPAWNYLPANTRRWGSTVLSIGRKVALWYSLLFFLATAHKTSPVNSNYATHIKLKTALQQPGISEGLMQCGKQKLWKCFVKTQDTLWRLSFSNLPHSCMADVSVTTTTTVPVPHIYIYIDIDIDIWVLLQWWS